MIIYLSPIKFEKSSLSCSDVTMNYHNSYDPRVCTRHGAGAKKYICGHEGCTNVVKQGGAAKGTEQTQKSISADKKDVPIMSSDEVFALGMGQKKLAKHAAMRDAQT
jgi:hypothetical protein